MQNKEIFFLQSCTSFNILQSCTPHIILCYIDLSSIIEVNLWPCILKCTLEELPVHGKCQVYNLIKLL